MVLRLDDFVLGMVDFLVAVCGIIHRQNIQRKNHSGIYWCGFNYTDHVQFHLDVGVWEQCNLV